MSDATNIVRPNIRDLLPYQPGKPVEEIEREYGIVGAIKMASNENPLGPSPLAIEAAAKAVRDMQLYPDAAAFYLRRELADYHDIDPARLVFGAGCNEVIQMLISTYCEPGRDQVLSHQYAFISYRGQTLAHGCEYVESEVNGQLGCDIDALLAKVTEHTRLILIANPNNPTGAHLSKVELERLLEGVPSHAIIVLDEAYHEYASIDGADYPHSQEYAQDRPLLVTLRTFSKIYGLAGLRVGYGICSSEVAGYINRMRRPFNVNFVAQEAARAALRDSRHVENSIALNNQGIAKLREAAHALGVTAYPSLGNFVLIDVGRPAAEVYQSLLREGIIVRPMGGWGLDTHLRFSVGTEKENEKAIEKLRKILA